MTASTTAPTTAPIAIQIKTFNRPERLIPTIESIIACCDVPYRLYVGDDGETTAATEKLYAALAREGHQIIRYPGRINVTAARNDMVARLREEEFVLRLDDDFNFSAETRIGAMLALLRARPEIGALADLERQLGDSKGTRSQSISNKQGHLVIHNGTLHKIYVEADGWIYQTAAGVRFAYAAFTRNFLLIRRQVFERVRWNEKLVIQGEHEAFMIDLQRAGWSLAFTPDSIHIHNELPAPEAKGYGAARDSAGGRAQHEEVFLQAYGVTKVAKHNLIDRPGGTSWLRALRKRAGLR